MPRVRRWIAATAVGSACVAVTACVPKTGTPAAANAPAEPPKPAPVEIGSPLYKAAPMPKVEAPAPAAEPVVIHPAFIQYDHKVQIPAQVDGLIELIATPLKPGEVADPADPLIVYHPRDDKKEQAFRRLRENDRVERGQTLVRLDEQLVARQMDTSDRMIRATDQAIQADKKALASYKVLLQMSEDLLKKGTGSLMAVKENETTVARLEGSYVGNLKEKAKAEGDLLQAQTQLTRYWCRSPVNGRVMKLLKTPGEYAKAGDVILEIQSTDRIRVEGKLPVEYAAAIKNGMPAVVEPTVPLGPMPFANWHRQEVNAVAVTSHPGRPLIVSGGADATALVWDVTASKQSHRLPHPAGVGVRAVATSPATGNKVLAATGGDDGKVRLWDLTNPDRIPTEPLAVLEDGHGAAVTAAAFSPDGRFLATAAGREVFVWDVDGKKKKYALPPEHRDVVSAVRFTPQARLVTESRDRTIRLWNLGENGAAVTEPVIDHRSGAVDVLGVSADGTKVLFDKDAARLDVLSLADGRTLGTVVNPGGAARFAGLAIFSPDDKWILTAGGDADVKGELQLWEAPAVGGRASERRRLLTPNRASVTCAAFSADPAHPFVVVGTQYGGVHFWTPEWAGQRGKRLVGKVESVLPADARSVQVRVVMEQPGEGADILQDRGLATIIINPDGSVPVTGAAPQALPLPAPAPRPMGAAAPKPDNGLKLAGGAVEGGDVLRASASAPAESLAAAPVRSQPIPTAPLSSAPTSFAPVASPPAAGISAPRVGPAVFTLPSAYPAPRK